MKDAYYFSHDCNARHDPKVTAMRGVYGPRGYGWYWILVEMMRESEEYKLEMQGKYAFHAFASQMQCEPSEAQEFITDCINEFGLFASDGTSFWSISLLRRMERMEKRSDSARKSAEARWSKKSASDKASSKSSMPSTSKGNANASKNDALKESKEKETKEEEIKQQQPAEAPASLGSADDDLYRSGPLPPVSNVYRMFEAEGFGTISPSIKEQLEEFIRDYGERWVCEAMKKAVLSGKRNLSYVGGTLVNWKADGIDDPWNKKRDRQQTAPMAGRSGKRQIEIAREPEGGAPTLTPEEHEEMMEFARKFKEEKERAREEETWR